MKRLLLILVVPILVNASDLTCSKNGTVIFYSNGVNVLKEEAKGQAKSVETILETPIIESVTSVKDYRKLIDSKANIIGVYSVYNQHKSLMEDVLEAVVQKTGTLEGYRDAYESFYKVLHGKVILSDSVGQELASELTSKEVEYLENLANQTKHDVNLLTQYYEKALDDTCKNIFDDWENGVETHSEDCRYKVIGFSHSQGGLFVNDAYDNISSSLGEEKKRFFGAYQVATPASSISADKGLHKTYYGDMVIGPIVGSLSSNLNDPISITRPSTDFWTQDNFLNHGLMTTYLNNYYVDESYPNQALRTAVLDGFGEVAQKLDGNCNEPPEIIIYDDTGTEVVGSEHVLVDYGGSVTLSIANSLNPDDPNGDYKEDMTAKWSYTEYTGVYSTIELPKVDTPTVYNGQEVTIGGFQFTMDYEVTVTVTDVEGDTNTRKFTIEVVNEAPVFSTSFSCTGPCNTGEGSNYPTTLYVTTSPENHDFFIEYSISPSYYNTGALYVSTDFTEYGEDRYSCLRRIESDEESWYVNVSAQDMGGLITSTGKLKVPDCTVSGD